MVSACYSPFDLLRGLGHEETDSVGRHLVGLGVDGDLGVASAARLHWLDFYSEQQQLQLDKAQPIRVKLKSFLFCSGKCLQNFIKLYF